MVHLLSILNNFTGFCIKRDQPKHWGNSLVIPERWVKLLGKYIIMTLHKIQSFSFEDWCFLETKQPLNRFNLLSCWYRPLVKVEICFRMSFRNVWNCPSGFIKHVRKLYEMLLNSSEKFKEQRVSYIIL